MPKADEAPPEAPPRIPSQRDAIQVLFSRKAIDEDQVRAAMEIRECWRAVTGSLWARAQNFDGTRTGRTSADWPRGLATAYLERYKPWADAMGAKRCRGGSTFLSVAFDAVVDERTLGEIDADHGWQHGTASDYVREALETYVRMARWRMAA